MSHAARPRVRAAPTRRVLQLCRGCRAPERAIRRGQTRRPALSWLTGPLQTNVYLQIIVYLQTLGYESLAHVGLMAAVVALTVVLPGAALGLLAVSVPLPMPERIVLSVGLGLVQLVGIGLLLAALGVLTRPAIILACMDVTLIGVLGWLLRRSPASRSKAAARRPALRLPMLIVIVFTVVVGIGSWRITKQSATTQLVSSSPLSLGVRKGESILLFLATNGAEGPREARLDIRVDGRLRIRRALEIPAGGQRTVSVPLPARFRLIEGRLQTAQNRTRIVRIWSPVRR